MPLRNALCALVALLVVGCSQQELMEKLASEEDRKLATECLDRLRSGDIAALEAQLDPSVKAPNIHETLVQMAEALPDGTPDSSKLVGVQTNTNNGVRTANLTYEYDYGGKWYLVNCAHKKEGAALTIVGLNVEPRDKTVEEQGQLDLKGKSAKHYLVLVAAILFVLVSLVAMFVCIRERGLQRKWAWILFIILGIGDLTLNWNTGETTFSALALQLFSAGTSVDQYGGVVISVALPVGAVLYLWRRFLNHRRADRSNPA